MYIYHNTDVAIPDATEINMTQDFCSVLEPVLMPSQEGVANVFGSHGASKKPNMLTLALKIESEANRPLKNIVIAAVVDGATIRHTIQPAGLNWFEQMSNLVEVEDCDVLGYTAPAILTEMHIHVHNSAVEYRPGKYWVLEPLCLIGHS